MSVLMSVIKHLVTSASDTMNWVTARACMLSGADVVFYELSDYTKGGGGDFLVS